ncbi:MAG: ABC transporter permease subunit, partial [Cellulomonas sp.]|nr:ABC transporter permease subunit [Cellulomonas sp.]
MNPSSGELFRSSLWPLVRGALTGTIPLSLISFILGLLLALTLALMRLSGNRWLASVARVYISIVRGTPLLVQLFVIFYGLPSIGILINP